MNNPLDKVYLSKQNLENLASGGSIPSGDDSYSADENAIYLVPDEIGDLVQTTGQSTTDVMSQKAVTDAINALVLTQSTDLSSATPTVNLVANTRYAFGELDSLDITFPASGNDGDEIIIEFVSGSTATNLVRDVANAVYNFNSVGTEVFVEFKAQYRVSINRWVVLSTEVDISGIPQLVRGIRNAGTFVAKGDYDNESWN